MAPIPAGLLNRTTGVTGVRRNMNIGSSVQLITIPANRSRWDLETRTLFEKCLGGTFRVVRMENSKKPPYTLMVLLEVGHVVDKRPEHEIICVPAAYVQELSQC